VDTGVAVSAVLLPRSVPRQAFDAAAARGRLLVSEATLAELDEVLRRPRFDQYVPEEKRLEFLAALVAEAERVEVTEVITACRDAKDNKFLELAVSGQASHILSGHGDLLALHPFRGIAVVTPQGFLESLRESGAERGAAADGGRDPGAAE
jgi:putative PIN family toxin of toxin-antitoxin system